MATASAKPRKPRAKPHDRRKHLGGSDAAAVLGLSPWTTPVQLWMEKTGRAPERKTDPMRERVLKRGKKLEPIVLAMVVDKLRERGVDVELVARNRRYSDPTYPFLNVEIDFELVITGVLTINGEDIRFDHEEVNGDCKTVTGFARKKWGDEDTEDVPIEYAAQFMTGLGVTGRDYCLVAALIGLDDVAIYWVKRDDETLAAMWPKLVDFWHDHVLADVAPDPLKYSDITALFPLDNGRTVEATPEVAEAAREHRRIGLEIDALKARRDMLQLQVGEYMADFKTLAIEGRPVYTLASYDDTSIDTTALRRDHPDWAALYARGGTVRALRPNKNFRG